MCKNYLWVKKKKIEFQLSCWWELLLCPGTYGGHLLQPKWASLESKWSPRCDETGDDLTVPCPSFYIAFKWKATSCCDKLKRPGLGAGAINPLYAWQAKPSTDGECGKSSLPFTSNTVYSGRNDRLISKGGVAAQEEWWGEIKKGTKNEWSGAGAISQPLESEAVGEGESIWAGNNSCSCSTGD